MRCFLDTNRSNDKVHADVHSTQYDTNRYYNLFAYLSTKIHIFLLQPPLRNLLVGRHAAHNEQHYQ
jgi:hypothetical protein